MNQILIKNARIINEGKIISSDIFIENEMIKEVSKSISLKSSSVQIIDAENNFVMPGIIDDQVHFLCQLLKFHLNYHLFHQT